MIDNHLKKTVIRSTRFSPALIDIIKTECAYRRIDFSNHIRNATTVAMKHNIKSGSAEASKGQTGNNVEFKKRIEYDNLPEPKRTWPAELFERQR